MLLDTMVVAEPLRDVPDQNVMRWLDAQALETCYVAAPSIGELLREIEKLPAAKRKSAYGVGVAEAMLPGGGDRVSDGHAGGDGGSVVDPWF